MTIKICRIDGCNKPVKGRSKCCSMHCARLLRTGRPDLMSYYEKLLSRMVIAGNGCWEYKKHLTNKGYGRLRSHRKKTLAHRLMYEQVYGKIPDGMLVLHKCDNPACINPEHLYLGDKHDNGKDMSERNRCWLQRAKAQGLKFCLSKGVKPIGYQKIRSN